MHPFSTSDVADSQISPYLRSELILARDSKQRYEVHNNTGHAGHYGSIMPEYALPSTPSKARSAEDGVRGSAYEGIFEP